MVLFIAVVILPIPLAKYLQWIGMLLYLLLFFVTMYFAIRVEKHKKKYDIQTYKEIVAFSEGKSLDEIEKARESGKRPYQKVALAMGAALLGVIATAFMIWILN